LANENREKFLEKVKLGKFGSPKNLSEIGGKFETEVKCIIASGGMDAPDDVDQLLFIIRIIIQRIAHYLFNHVHVASIFNSPTIIILIFER